ncbi:MAG: hypothetical protein M1840_007119 [Geoglossum simile]|nr:MAG: hypothetical protein M1840_007119 [Geoglossum simile]
MGSGEHEQSLLDYASTSQGSPSPSTSIESGDNLLDVNNNPEYFYKYPGKKFSLGPSSLIPEGDVEIGRKAGTFNMGFKVVDENWDPDACTYKSKSEEIGDNRVIYSFVIRRQHGKPNTTINHNISIKSRELQNIVHWALGKTMSGTLGGDDLTVDLDDLCNALPRLEDSLEHLKTLVEFLKQLQGIEHGSYMPTHSPDLPAKDINHSGNVVDSLHRFPFIPDGDTGNEVEN